jgi:hypothetical protein
VTQFLANVQVTHNEAMGIFNVARFNRGWALMAGRRRWPELKLSAGIAVI